jgi:hypothetical protein
MNEFDLHGIKHEDVKWLVEDHLLTCELPTVIVTGNSLEMRRLVLEVVSDLKMGIFESSRTGMVTVLEKPLSNDK